MPLLTIGISHQTAPIAIRERVALPEADRSARLKSLVAVDGIDEAILLATCNRTEMYCYGDDPQATSVLDWVHRSWNVADERLDRYFYMHHGTDAVRHLIRVAGGMDSLVLGESQILGQIKQAWREAREAQTVGVFIDRLCQHALMTAKSIRNLSEIGDKPISVAYTAIVLARQLFSDLGSRRVLLIGAGEMIELCARHLVQHGVSHLTIANRDASRAADLAAELGAEPVALSGLAEVLPQADIVISSTSSESPVITLEAVRQALAERRHKPMFMVDIAVPRDVEASVGDLDDVYLYTIDDLQQVVDENLENRSSAARAAETDVEESVNEFVRWMNGTRAADALQLMRVSAHDHSRELVERAMRRLQAGHDPKAVLEQLGSTLTNRILHAPTKHLRQAAERNDLEAIATINRIFEPEGDAGSKAEAGSEDVDSRDERQGGRAGGSK